ncbi:NAD(P)H-quinone oxidoreductase [Granulicoccus sp. GXG6511]|uniref:NAD(P)H-quinone oxidoreductase n=1 Tax=Granulicoccus sp. GXG6511 TaxID=3381351 RepID=UPI003D7C905E
MSDDVPTTMRAVLASGDGGPEVLSLGEAPTPTPRAGEVLVKVTAAGLNRADVMQRKGFYPPPPGASEIIGLEVSGHIAAIGEGVTTWQVGEPCVALLAGGGYAEYAAVEAAQVIPPPPGVDLVTAAGVLEVAATVHSNARVANLNQGETFLVHGGAGGIGSFAIQYATALGCTVWTTAGSAGKLDFCRELGADLAVDYHDDWAAAFGEAGGADVVLDNQGARYLAANTGVLKPDGRLVVIGLQGGRKAELDLGALLRKRNHVIATSLRSRPADQKAEICAAVVETIWPMYADGRIKTAPTKTFAAAEATDAHAYFDSGDHRGKIVLTF